LNVNRISLVALVCGLGAGAFAQTQTFRDFQYVVQDFDTNPTVTITRYTGSAEAVTVPAEINGLPVVSVGGGAFERCSSIVSVSLPARITAIGNLAFFGCPNLASITVPAGVTAIGDFAFSCCTSLTAIAVDPGNTAYTSREGVLFDKTGAVLVSYPAGKTAETSSYAIPAGITSIRNFAFYGCTGLVSVTIPAGVTAIGDAAFAQCTGLVSVTIPASVAVVGEAAFYGCTSLIELNLPRNAAVGADALPARAGLVYAPPAEKSVESAVPTVAPQAEAESAPPPSQAETASPAVLDSADAPSPPILPVQKKKNAPRLTALSVGIGSSFSAPWAIAAAGFTFAPRDNLFVGIGFDVGLVSGIEGAGYFSLYPYAHIGYFRPFADWGGWYADAGGGYMFQTWTFETGEVKNNTFAVDAALGVVLWNHLDISYTLRTNFASVNHKVSVGFIYRFNKRN
jgi:hypothetical protein